MRPRSRSIAMLAALTLVLGAAACSKDDASDDKKKDTTTTSEATSTTSAAEEEATVRFDKEIQSQLIAVGCYKGADDGIIGPETDAAIVAFQRADGLEVDGELGPETEAALDTAVSEGKQVCTDTTSTTAAPTTTAGGGGEAPCTASALLEGLPDEGESVTSYVCADGYAAGSVSGGTKFILQSEGGKWYAPGQDPCGSASAGLPPVILEDGC